MANVYNSILRIPSASKFAFKAFSLKTTFPTVQYDLGANAYLQKRFISKRNRANKDSRRESLLASHSHKASRGLSIRKTKKNQIIKKFSEEFKAKRESIENIIENPIEKRYELAKTYRDRFNELKKKKVLGVGFTPARFQLYPIENESKTEIFNVLQKDNFGNIKKSLKMSEVRELLTKASFDDLYLDPKIVSAAKTFITQTCLDNKNSFSLHPDIKEAIENPKPTPIQTLAIPEILKLRDDKTKQTQSKAALLAAETGSGKTLAYLLPIIDILKKEESDMVAALRKSKSRAPDLLDALQKPEAEVNWAKFLFKERRPRVIIIVPTNELAKQTLQTCKKLCHSIKFNATMVDRTKGLKKNIQKTENSILDLVIGTPAFLKRCFYRGSIMSLANARYVIVDEADTIMDEQGHLEDTLALLKQIHFSNTSVAKNRFEKVLFVSATLPKTVVQRINELYPNIVNISTPNLHRVNPKIDTTNIDIARNFNGNKMNALTQVLSENNKDLRTIIFCNNVKSCIELYLQLAYMKLPVLLLTNNLKTSDDDSDNYKFENENNLDQNDNDDSFTENSNINKETSTSKKSRKDYKTFDYDQIDTVNLRKSALSIFNSDKPIPDYGEIKLPSHYIDRNYEPLHIENKNSKILITSDLGSRGLDTMNVDHVIMFDYPTTAINYIHRSGRVGRIVNRGKITTFIASKDRKNAQRIGLFLKSGFVIG
ncbi:hypothetical protein BB561_002255 [Smittium simulii]|uniref:RNA helicase n=1 Tax=Smittium simulii TaxID=133385 RepID=A0A2T9YR11_9FUNG|nr:hypothetical protein BB561_002255 [Smittium simulii]